MGQQHGTPFSSRDGEQVTPPGALETLTLPSARRQCICTPMASHLIVFQEDQAYHGEVDGVPDAGVVEDASHLPGSGQAVTLALALGHGQPLPTPSPHPGSQAGELRGARGPPPVTQGVSAQPRTEGHPQRQKRCKVPGTGPGKHLAPLKLPQSKNSQPTAGDSPQASGGQGGQARPAVTWLLGIPSAETPFQ